MRLSLKPVFVNKCERRSKTKRPSFKPSKRFYESFHAYTFRQFITVFSGIVLYCRSQFVIRLSGSK